MSSPATRARLGVSLLFFLNGFVLANLLPRLPEVRAALELPPEAFGLVLACMTVGAIGAFALPAPLIRRFGAARVAILGTVVIAVLIALAGVVVALGASSAGEAGVGASGSGMVVGVWVFAALYAVIGFSDAVVDAAQNVHGLAVETACGRAVFNSFHAAWSVGSVSGGALGLGAAAVGIPLPVHLAGAGVLALGLTGWALREDRATRSWVSAGAGAGRSTVEVPEEAGGHHREPHPPGPEVPRGTPGSGASAVGRGGGGAAWGLFAVVVTLGLLGALGEDIGMNWSSLFLEQVGGVPVEWAGAAFVTALGSQFLARLSADRIQDRWGAVALVRGGGVLTAVGMGLMMLVGQPWAVLVGFALSGFGCATFVPIAYAAAGRLPGFKHGTAVTITSWVLRIGSLVSSPTVGFLAAWLGLRWAFLAAFCAGVAAIALAGRLRFLSDTDR